MSINVSYPTSIQGSTSVLGSAYFFDIFPTASAAYSTRKLSRTATYCMKVRRTSDNATQDIGFGGLGGGLDFNALQTFAAGSDLLVQTWYDQSGNNRNAVQNTTSDQPAIYYSSGGSSGSVTFGYSSYLSINFQGSVAAGGNTYGWLNLSSAVGITNGGYYFNAYVASYRDIVDRPQPYLFYWSCNGSNANRHAIQTGTLTNKQYYRAYSRTNSSDTQQTTISNISNEQSAQIITMLSSTNNTSGATPYLNIYQNGVLGGAGGNIGGAIENANSNFALLGTGPAGTEWSGYIAEALFYNIDTNPYKAAIEQNMNFTFGQIY